MCAFVLFCLSDYDKTLSARGYILIITGQLKHIIVSETTKKRMNLEPYKNSELETLYIIVLQINESVIYTFFKQALYECYMHDSQQEILSDSAERKLRSLI